MKVVPGGINDDVDMCTNMILILSISLMLISFLYQSISVFVRNRDPGILSRHIYRTEMAVPVGAIGASRAQTLPSCTLFNRHSGKQQTNKSGIPFGDHPLKLERHRED